MTQLYSAGGGGEEGEGGQQSQPQPQQQQGQQLKQQTLSWPGERVSSMSKPFTLFLVVNNSSKSGASPSLKRDPPASEAEKPRECEERGEERGEEEQHWQHPWRGGGAEERSW